MVHALHRIAGALYQFYGGAVLVRLAQKIVVLVLNKILWSKLRLCMNFLLSQVKHMIRPSFFANDLTIHT